MNYKLKNVNGKVSFLLRAGKDMVRNQMAIASAQHIIDTGTIKTSDNKDYPICVDDKWYFEGEPMKPSKNPTAEIFKAMNNQPTKEGEAE